MEGCGEKLLPEDGAPGSCCRRAGNVGIQQTQQRQQGHWQGEVPSHEQPAALHVGRLRRSEEEAYDMGRKQAVLLLQATSLHVLRGAAYINSPYKLSQIILQMMSHN